LQYASSPVKTTQREETGVTGLMRRLNEMGGRLQGPAHERGPLEDIFVSLVSER
jgi:hypothetical protein